MKPIPLLALAAALSGCALGQGGPAAPNGRTAIQESTMPREEREPQAAKIPRPYSGTLVDGGCINRTDHNLGQQPLNFTSSIAIAPGSAGDQALNEGSSSGITVSPQTLQGERADIMPHQVPDMRTRQTDPTCAITANTRDISLLLGNGRLLRLDPGGNIYAWQGVYATSAGRAMLNGFAPGVKPLAKMKGYIQGNTLVVASPMDVMDTPLVAATPSPKPEKSVPQPKARP
jgi:hypothetical protein